MSLTDDLTERYGATMTPRDVAEVLGQHPAHVRGLCQSGELPAVRIGERWHVVTHRFAEMLDGGK